MKIPMFIIKLMVLGALFIISNQNLHLGISPEREIFLDAYSEWIKNIIGEVLAVTSYAVKVEWLPK